MPVGQGAAPRRNDVADRYRRRWAGEFPSATRRPTWLITLAYIVALVLVSRAIEKRTGRAGAPAPGRKRIAYIAVVAAGAVGSVVWLEHLVHREASPVLVCMATEPPR